MDAKQLLDDLQKDLDVMFKSMDLPTDVKINVSLQVALHEVVEKVSHRCTALVIAMQSKDFSHEALSSGCRIVHEAFRDFLSVWQVMASELSKQKLVVVALKPLVSKVFESMLNLIGVLRKGNVKSISPGTGLVWAACDNVKKFIPTTRAQVVLMLAREESHADDTVNEMMELPSVDDDEDEGLSPEERSVAECCVGALKAARGTLKGVRGLVEVSPKEFDVECLEKLAEMGSGVGRAVEDLGCSLYAPQDGDEVKSSLAALKVQLERICVHVGEILTLSLDEQSVARAGKMRNVALMLCDDAAKKINEMMTKQQQENEEN